MINTKHLKPIFCLSFLLFLIAGCVTTIPANDTSNPTLSFYVVGPTIGINTVASTNPNIALASFDCPTGTDLAGQTQVGFVTSIANDTVRFKVVGSDRGGVQSLRITVLHNQVNNIRIENTAGIEPQIIPGPNSVTIVATFTRPKTSQTLVFDVVGAGATLAFNGTVTDFSNNDSAVPPVNSGSPTIRIVDIARCNN